MLIAAAVCPHPPLLVPAAAGSAAAELDEMRGACDEAVGVLAAAAPELIVTVGGGTEDMEFDGGAAGSLAAYGVGWRTGCGAPVLPLSLTIGRWLLQRSGLLDADGEGRRPDRLDAQAGERGEPSRVAPRRDPVRPAPLVRLRATAFSTSPSTCLRIGAEIASRARRVALLAMGDGPACLSPQAPGYLDPRGELYDAAVSAALAGADTGRLARLDPGLSAELLAAGRAAWQVLAGAAGTRAYHGHLHCAAAPYGVSYLVASWTRC
ncbi:MAG TPA: hypothetical protein VLW50_18230 [Streptosporangiaceae bacterium]|nr:hypothetical protein [Streptosporangiaceae bacterium]